MHLRSLSEDDLQVLGQAGAWIETGGHPASLAACLTASRHGGVLHADAVAHLLALVDDCGELTRMVLEVAATLEQPMEIEELARCSRLALETTADLLDRAARLDLVRADNARRVAFAGDLTRRVLRAVAPH